MYITINDIKGEKTIDLSYPIKGKEALEGPRWQGPATQSTEMVVVSMFSNNAQFWLQRSIEVLLNTGKKIVLNKGVYMDKELDSLIGTELKSQMLDSHNDVLRTNKLAKVANMIFKLDKLDNTNNLKDGKPSNTLFTYYMPGSEDFMCFKPATP